MLASPAPRRRGASDASSTSSRTFPRRALLAEILADVSAGALSPLERRYLRDVERAHRLPGAGRQRPYLVDGSRVQRDVEYPAQATVVELDGRLNHEAAEDRWDDLDRDLSSAEAGKQTLRIGWRQVLQPCRTAATVAGILAARGWRGSPTRAARTASLLEGADTFRHQVPEGVHSWPAEPPLRQSGRDRPGDLEVAQAGTPARRAACAAASR